MYASLLYDDELFLQYGRFLLNFLSFSWVSKKKEYIPLPLLAASIKMLNPQYDSPDLLFKNSEREAETLTQKAKKFMNEL